MDNQTTIGSILLAMGAITDEELLRAMDDQEKLREDALLGKILVANGSCTSQQLEIAIAAQETMRSGDASEQALAIADLAISRKRRNSVIQFRQRVLEKGNLVGKKITREDHPAITPAMLAKNGD